MERGGTFVTTFYSGIVGESDLVTVGGYPGELRSVLGIWAEEIDALFPDQQNRIVMNREWGSLRGTYSCGLLCDLIHTEGAETLATYGSDFYQGMPALTVNRYGKGQAWYVATSPEPVFLNGLLVHLCEEKGIGPLAIAPAGIEVTRRVKDGKAYTFLLNHNDEATKVELDQKLATDLLTGRTISGTVSLPAKSVMILES